MYLLKKLFCIIFYQKKFRTAAYYKIENGYFKLQYYFTILSFLLYFWSNKCSLGEHEYFKNIFLTSKL